MAIPALAAEVKVVEGSDVDVAGKERELEDWEDDMTEAGISVDEKRYESGGMTKETAVTSVDDDIVVDADAKDEVEANTDLIIDDNDVEGIDDSIILLGPDGKSEIEAGVAAGGVESESSITSEDEARLSGRSFDIQLGSGSALGPDSIKVNLPLPVSQQSDGPLRQQKSPSLPVLF